MKHDPCTNKHQYLRNTVGSTRNLCKSIKRSMHKKLVLSSFPWLPRKCPNASHLTPDRIDYFIDSSESRHCRSFNAFGYFVPYLHTVYFTCLQSPEPVTLILTLIMVLLQYTLYSTSQVWYHKLHMLSSVLFYFNLQLRSK